MVVTPGWPVWNVAPNWPVVDGPRERRRPPDPEQLVGRDEAVGVEDAERQRQQDQGDGQRCRRQPATFGAARTTNVAVRRP